VWLDRAACVSGLLTGSHFAYMVLAVWFLCAAGTKESIALRGLLCDRWQKTCR